MKIKQTKVVFEITTPKTKSVVLEQLQSKNGLKKYRLIETALLDGEIESILGEEAF